MGRWVIGAALLLCLILPHYVQSTPVINHLALQFDDTFIDETVEIAQTNSESIEVIGAWGKSVLTILIIPDSDERYTRWAGVALDWWARSIETFTALHGYGYLSELRFVKLVQGVNGTSGDIVIEFTPTLGERVCGVAYPYIINGQIRSVSIELSKECIRGREEYALVVTMHEFGHALGLGHTENSKDLMYEYLVPGARPSTLNLYGLAVIYAWLDEGSFKRPPNQVGLSNEIDYMYLLDEKGHPIKLRVRIFLSLEGQEQLYQTIILNAGESFSISVNNVIAGQEGEWQRFVFAGWRLRNTQTTISTSNSLSVKPTGHVDYVAVYYTEYRVFIDYKVGTIVDRWVRRGERMLVNASNIVFLSSHERFVFKEWRGTTNSTLEVFEIIVQGPVRLYAVYQREFLVEVSSEFGEPVGSGWWPEGTLLNITVNPDIIYVTDLSRFYLSGFNGTLYAPTQTLSINLTHPLQLVATWVLQHLVTVASLGGEVKESFWMDNGTETIILAPPEVTWENRTKAVFTGWSKPQPRGDPYFVTKITGPTLFVPEYRRYYLVEINSAAQLNTTTGWHPRGEILELKIPETFELESGRRLVFVGLTGGPEVRDGLLSLIVNHPISLILHWREEALIVVEDEIDGSEKLIWAPLNQSLILHTPSLIQVGDDEALEFEKWAGDLESSANTLILTVNDSIKLTPKYRKLYQISIRTEPPVEADLILRDQFGRLYRVVSGESTWLPEGSLDLVGVDWMGRDVKRMSNLQITGPGKYVVEVSVKSISMRVVDLFGLPAPFYQVTIFNGEGVAESWGVSDVAGHTFLKTLGEGKTSAKARWTILETQADLNLSEPVIRVPLGLYTVLLLSVLATAACSILYWKRFNVSAS